MSPLTAAKKYLFLSWHVLKLHIMSEVEYRANFLIKLVGMTGSNLGLLAMWLIYFHQFPAINGWTLQDSYTLFSLNLFIYSLFGLTSAGVMELARYVYNGNMDYFLALPKNVLWQVSTSRTAIETLADMLFGLFMFFFFQPDPWTKLPIYLLVSLIAALILYNMAVIIFSLSFYLGGFEEGAERWFWAIFGFFLYPQSFFFGWLKVITLTVIPVFFIVGLPVEILNNFNLTAVLYMLGFWLATLVLSQIIFRNGLRRYESGSLINVRM